MQREQPACGHRQGGLLPQRRRLSDAGQEGPEAAGPALFQGNPEITASCYHLVLGGLVPRPFIPAGRGNPAFSKSETATETATGSPWGASGARFGGPCAIPS